MADNALSVNANDVLNNDDMGVMAVSNVECIVDVSCSDTSDCEVNDISGGVYEVAATVLIPSLVQLAKTVADNRVSSVCAIRKTFSVMQVLSDAILHTEVRYAGVQVDIHDLLAYHLPDTFSCFPGVLVSSVIDKMAIKQSA